MKWELEQKQRELEAQKQQLEMMEQCHHRELDNLQRALQASIHFTVKNEQNTPKYSLQLT